jgi:hypothetical protein
LVAQGIHAHVAHKAAAVCPAGQSVAEWRRSGGLQFQKWNPREYEAGNQFWTTCCQPNSYAPAKRVADDDHWGKGLDGVGYEVGVLFATPHSFGRWGRPESWQMDAHRIEP